MIKKKLCQREMMSARGTQYWNERAAEYHKANPHIYNKLVELAREVKQTGRFKHIGIELLVNQVRWLHAVDVTMVDQFKLNQNYAAYYARSIMKQEPELAGFFKTRNFAQTSPVRKIA